MKERERAREEGRGREEEEAKLLLLLLSFIIAHYRTDGRTAAIVRTWHGGRFRRQCDNARSLPRSFITLFPMLRGSAGGVYLDRESMNEIQSNYQCEQVGTVAGHCMKGRNSDD